MSNAWQMVTLGDVASVQSGFAFKSSQWTHRGVPVVKIANVKSGRIDLTTNQAFISEADAQRAARFRLKRGDIVVGMTGYVGEVAQVRTDDSLLLNQRVGLLQVDEKLVDRQYLFHTLRSEQFRSEARSLAYGSAQPNISPSLLQSITIPLPPIPEQRAIAATLGALDDKIESNRHKQRLAWELVTAEWEQLSLNGEPAIIGDLLSLAYGKALPAKNRIAGDVPVYGSSGVVGLHNKAAVTGPAVVVGRKGTVGTAHWSHVDAFPIDTTFFVKPIDEWPLLACFMALRSAGLTEMNSDSAVPGLNRDRAHAAEILVPDLRSAVEWSARHASTLRLIRLLDNENTHLNEIQDTLLPELLSGRLRAPVGTL